MCGDVKLAPSLKEGGRVGSGGSQMAGSTLASAGVPAAPSVLGFMALSAAEAVPLRCLAAGKAHNSAHTVCSGQKVWRRTFAMKTSLRAKAVDHSFSSHHGSDHGFITGRPCLPQRLRRWTGASQSDQEHILHRTRSNSSLLPALPLFTSVMWPASSLNLKKRKVTEVLKLLSVYGRVCFVSLDRGSMVGNISKAF